MAISYGSVLRGGVDAPLVTEAPATGWPAAFRVGNGAASARLGPRGLASVGDASGNAVRAAATSRTTPDEVATRAPAPPAPLV